MEQQIPADWLVRPCAQKAEIYRSADGKDLILSNGLLKRTFRVVPDVACTDFKNLSNSQQLLRALSPEARIIVDGKTYHVGGLKGQTEKAYLLPEWLDGFSAQSSDFQLENIESGPLKPFLNWKPKTWVMNPRQPTGKTLTFRYKAIAPEISGLKVRVVYELYDGLPLIVKWMSVENAGTKVLKLNRSVHEILAFVEEESAVVGKPEQMKKQHGLYVETNFAFNNAMRYDISDQTTHWKTDSSYTSQVNYNYKTPCVLEIYPEKSPGIELQQGETYRSVRTCELLMDSYDRERRGLAIRRMYRTIAPWTTQNPIFMHLVSQNDQQVRDIVDQCAGYKQYRDILNSDIIHLRRPDGRDWDGILHVNPDLETKGFLLLYNPLKIPITRTIRVPLYYTGLEDEAIFFAPQLYEEMVVPIKRNYEVDLRVTIPAEGWIYYIIN